MISRENQLTGFYMMATLAFNELSLIQEIKKSETVIFLFEETISESSN